MCFQWFLWWLLKGIHSSCVDGQTSNSVNCKCPVKIVAEILVCTDARKCSVVNNISFKALVYTLCEDNLVPWLCYSFSDISLSACLFTCVYVMLVALSMCLRVGAGIVEGSWGSSDHNIFSSSVGMLIATDWCVTGRGFTPRRVQLLKKFLFQLGNTDLLR